MAAPQFRHRIPMPLRRNWKLLVASLAFVAVMIAFYGTTRIRPYITGDATVMSSAITENVTGTVDLFDDSVAHTISIDISDTEYQEMVSAYENNGDKDWATADMTIDGMFLGDVAVRLKGNSTLMSLRGDGGVPAMGPPEGMDLPEGMTPPEGIPLPDGMAGAGGVGGAGGMGFPGAMGDSAAISAEDPTSLPLLISFDKYYSGRAYQGMTQLAVRPGSPVVNEAMALSLTAATNQPTQQFAYTEYSINDSATSTRLVLEHPDEHYANALFDSPGYLYKADASSTFKYAGDDQSAYSDQFKQINAKDDGTLQPIIDFLRWLDEADDATFDAELGQWVDVGSFARYVATQNLLSNFDDMSGPGQNYYLWFDLDTKLLSVISWDLNLAMTGDTATGPQDSVSMMAGGAPAAAAAPAGADVAAGAGQDGVLALREGAAIPNDAVPPQAAMPGGARNDGAAGAQTDGAPGGRQGGMPGGQQGGMPGGRPGSGNTLKTKFLASDGFRDTYESAYWDLFEQIYGNGAAISVLDGLAQSIPVTDGLTAEALVAEIESMRGWVDQRAAALAALRG